MTDSPSRRGVARTASQNKSYVDMTALDPDDDVEMMPVQSMRKENQVSSSSKRKRVASTPPATDAASDDDDNDNEGDEEEYEVDYIVNSRWRTTKGIQHFEYLIHWTGYGEDDRSWTDGTQFDHDDPPVLAFHEKYPKKPKRDTGKSTRGTPNRAAKGVVKPATPVSLGSPPSSPIRQAKKDEVEVKDKKKDVEKEEKTPSQQRKLNGMGDLRGFFERLPGKSTPASGKENKVDVGSSGKTDVGNNKATGKEPVKPLKVSTVQAKKPPAKRRRMDSEESDFIPDGAAANDDDDDDDDEDGDGDFADGDDSKSEGGDGLESDGMDEDDMPVKKPAKSRAFGGGGKSKETKPVRRPVNLGSFKSGVKPLGQKEDVKSAIKNMSEDLPPMNDIEAMFDHLVSRVPGVTKLVDRLNGRKLRVATMCSGTESPLLALNMIAKAIKEQHGQTLGFEHVFSCEIEPFKQAYIERNFAPPILFRDVTELGKKRAHTAYGSLVAVPGNVDILIAGTSCVDYSNLNNQQQDIDANGESGRTFRGMLQWVKKHQPPIVILENVCSAPWDKVVEYFADIDYDADFMRLDTKEFYIPHTRTRVYLFATPTRKGSSEHLSEKWAATVKDMRRPWSSPFEAFLLHADDANIHRARLDLTAAKELKDGNQRKATDWNRCESRHHRARQDEQLGLQRPLTSWQEAGVCKGLDWTWNDWLLSQTERVVDLLDISTLRMAKDGIDSGYKACIWNVSQNVDRQSGGARTALAPCLTPNMIPWVTNRGGPVTGREALALQGIPVRELLLTSENEDQLADLAGNAMSTTVVGSSMLAALMVTMQKITPGENADKEAARILQEAEAVDDQVTHRVIGEDQLERHELDLAKVATANLAEMMSLAERSSRHCQCEGQTGTASPIDECKECGYRACKGCGGRPDHHYQPCENVRVEPAEFEKQFKELLPMRVKIAGVTEKSLTAARSKAEEGGKGKVEEKDWTLWSEAVLGAVDDAEFRFRYLKRQYTWTAVYEAPNAMLDLFLQAGRPEWRLTIKAPVDEPVNSRLRSLLLHPVARLRFDIAGQDVLCGPWEVCIPSRQSFKVDIHGRGELVPSWHASMGLQGEFEGTQRWSQVEVVLPDEAVKALDRDVSGTYTLLPKCGQAMNSLHKREAKSSDAGSPDLCLFLDPTRCGEADNDVYVFSTSTERVDYGTERANIAVLESKWRETAKPTSKVRMDVRGGWVVCDDAHLTAVGGTDIAVVPTPNAGPAKRDAASYAIHKSSQSVAIDLNKADCEHATALLSCTVPLDPAHSEPMWKKDKWGEIDVMHQGNTTFANLAWITERLPMMESTKQWSALSHVEGAGLACQRCAPRPPKIHWIKRAGALNKNGGKTKSTIVAFEDKLEAGRYEHALKNRPAPFVVQLRLDRDLGSFRIGLNIVSLAHRALARLPTDDGKGQINLSWRLSTGQIADVPRPPRVFVLPSNKRDPSHVQPRGFLLDLRKEQLRSLWWMLEQERTEGRTHTFIEEEISEAALPALGWRAEGKAERPVMVRGGVIADQVGYGKTIISLALIAESKGKAAPEPAPKGLIDLKATLIVVPGHLSKQWPSEISRFTSKMFKTVVIQNTRDLSSKSISELSKADIIVIASEILDSDSYWERVEYLSVQPEEWLQDKAGGRFFSDRLDTALASLRNQVQILQEKGAAVAASGMAEHQAKAKQDAESKREAHKTANFGKRMKGQAYRDRYNGDGGKKKSKSKTGEQDLWEASEDEESEVDEPLPVPSFRKAKGDESFSHSRVQQDYTALTAPVMHMFRFRRVIADEFTYLDKKALAGLLRLQSCYKWVLSGTPPVSDFPAIRSIAAFMGIHLGVEDDAEGTAANQKARAKEQTAAEKFHAFREVHSSAWHKRRDDLAQEFLDVFVRQNIAEIEDIPTVEHIHEIKLPASEAAVYLELEHHLQALEMQARKETKFKNVTQGDRVARLEEALADSRTAEEALLKRCCHFTLDLSDKKRDAKSAAEACQHISRARSNQLKGCEEDLYRSINTAVGLHLHIRKKGFYGKGDDSKQHFKDFVEYSFDRTTHQGDADAAVQLRDVLQRCGFGEDGSFPSTTADGKAPKLEAKAKVEDVQWQLREQSHLLRRLSKELVARVRSLRFFEVIRKLQKGGKEASEVLEASACPHRPSTHPGIEMAVLSCCGHVACFNCICEAAASQRCVKGSDCAAAVRITNIVKVSSLGIEGELSSGRYGAKLQKLVDLIKSIPKAERILVFLQWEDLAGKLSEALDEGNIRHVTLSGSVKSRANTLDRFQQGDADDARVLLLKINDASAAGSNLTTANHAIFLGPLFTNSLLNYRAVETQAIGRIRRYGQERKVHIHRLLALDTIDKTIFDARTQELSAKADYTAIPRAIYEGEKKAATTEGKADGAAKVGPRKSSSQVDEALLINPSPEPESKGMKSDDTIEID